MPLPAGRRLGPYEILGPLGAGGMGEVYRARDTRLDRTVAVKVLPSKVAGDSQLKARFEREAKAISALAHPNICTLHDVGEEDGQTFLVMEHLDGQTLAERLKKGPLPLDQALEVAAQIADGLTAAHKQGIVHRDLKPGNIMLTKTGARLLDFGLARLTAHGERPAVEAVSSAPTEAEPLTGAGTVLGTLPYMAPEQVEGKDADARTDLWALGAILYEMLAGRRAFEGSSSVSLIAAILEREPAPIADRQPLAPPALERLVRRCLAKDPDDRWDTAHDVAGELRWIGETAGATASLEGPRLIGRAPASAALLFVGVLLGAAGLWLLKPDHASQTVVRSLLDAHPAETVNSGGLHEGGTPTPGGSRTALAWTPDGQELVFVGRSGAEQRLYVRALDATEARALEGTEGAVGPAVSPDGEWVAFWVDREIRKVPLSGGPTALVATEVDIRPAGMAWGEDGQLYYGNFGPRGSIWQASPSGEKTAVTTMTGSEVAHQLPSLLPGGEVLLFTARTQPWSWSGEELIAQRLATGERQVLLRDATDARYVASGHLVFLRLGVLFAVAFDPEKLEVRGEPVPLIEDVAQALIAGNHADVSGAGQVAVAANGSLALLRGTVTRRPDTSPVTVDRAGQVSSLSAPPHAYSLLQMSPDGRWLALRVSSLEDSSLFLYDLERRTLGRLTSGEEIMVYRWSPDSRHLAIVRTKDGEQSLSLLPADGSEPPASLAEAQFAVSSWSPDGTTLAGVRFAEGSDSNSDIWVGTLGASETTLEPLIQSPHAEFWPAFSPDGRWLVYGADDSGRWEVYVQPFPGPGPRAQVSVDGGSHPSWNPAGGELFFVTPGSDGPDVWHMMVVEVDTKPELRIGVPRELFSYPREEIHFLCIPVNCYSVSPDGQRFFVIQSEPQTGPPLVTHIHLVQNWLEEVKARVPTD